VVTSVNTNINAMAAIDSLDQINNQMTMTQSAIGSGLSVNAAADNPAVFSIAPSLLSSIDAISAINANLNTANATIQAQIQGVTSISHSLDTLLQTVTQGQGQTGAALAATNASITVGLGAIDAYANASTINGINLLASASTVSVVSNVDGTTINITTTTASTADGLGLGGLQINPGGTTLTASGPSPFPGGSVSYTNAQGDQTIFQFVPWNSTQSTTTTSAGVVGTDGKTYNSVTTVPVVIGATSSDTMGSRLSATQLNDDTMGSLLSAMQANGVAASMSSSGQITVSGGGVTAADTAAAAAAGVTTGIVSDATTTNSVAALTTASTTTVTETIGDSGANLSVTGSSPVGLDVEARWNGNSLTVAVAAGDVTAVITAETPGSGAGANSAASAAFAGGSLTATPTAGNAASAIVAVNNAIARNRATLSYLGAASTQLQDLADYTTQLSDSVTTGLGNMVDPNLSAESAQLSSLQTKQSLALQSLTLANQSPNSLLQLFR
jgi:flagellin